MSSDNLYACRPKILRPLHEQSFVSGLLLHALSGGHAGSLLLNILSFAHRVLWRQKPDKDTRCLPYIRFRGPLYVGRSNHFRARFHAGFIVIFCDHQSKSI
jgi:hypothetical protein